MIGRRDFLAMGAATFAAMALEDIAFGATSELAYAVASAAPDAIGLKIWLNIPPTAAPVLMIDGHAATGRAIGSGDMAWRFERRGLIPGHRYQLDLIDGGGKRLREPWSISTLPGRTAMPGRFRILFYTCTGGDPDNPSYPGKTAFLGLESRHALLDRALALAPDLVVANGDHLYWDQQSSLVHANPLVINVMKAFYAKLATLDPASPADGAVNARALAIIARRQIAAVYGDRLAGVPTVFVADDHDYFENDIAGDWGATFPPSRFARAMQAATAELAYPIAFGTTSAASVARVRIGALAELLLYDCRRDLSTAVGGGFLSPAAEHLLIARTRHEDTRHLIHVPSVPFGYGAGKWGEWYADRGNGKGSYGDGGKDKWNPSWFDQHQRLVAAMTGQRQRRAVVVSGDLHASAASRIVQSGDLNLTANPMTSILAGPIGTGDLGFPSAARGEIASRPKALSGVDIASLTEKNGFTIVDLMPTRIDVQMFTWRPPEALGDVAALGPAHQFSVPRF